MKASADSRLTHVRRIRAAPAKVYAAFVEPDEIIHWWGPDAGPTLSAETDVRVGGRFRVVFRTMDGDVHESLGEYLELDPPRRIVMSWWWSRTPDLRSRVTITIEPMAAGSELTVVHEGFIDTEPPYTHDEGWAGALGRLQTHLEKEPT
jgi:uncharacterized protein YndB with AHSA1/START domain